MLKSYIKLQNMMLTNNLLLLQLATSHYVKTVMSWHKKFKCWWKKWQVSSLKQEYCKFLETFSVSNLLTPFSSGLALSPDGDNYDKERFNCD